MEIWGKTRGEARTRTRTRGSHVVGTEIVRGCEEGKVAGALFVNLLNNATRMLELAHPGRVAE